MVDIHAHEVLRMMEGNDYTTKEMLKKAIVDNFGAEQTFCTCSVKGLDIESIIEFLEKKGKFKSSSNGGFTMDLTKVCKSY